MKLHPVRVRWHREFQSNSNETEYGKTLIQRKETSRKTREGGETFFDWEQIVTAEMGGEVAELINRLEGRRFHCAGRNEGHIETVGKWYGYSGHGGLLDSNGLRWWVYQKCSVSDYNVAFWKIEHLLASLEGSKNSCDIFQNSERNEYKKWKIAELRMGKKDYYRILAVNRESTPEEIKRVYLYLVKGFHPDTTTIDKETASETMKAINEAYEVLSDPAKRSKYDAECLRNG